MSVILDALQKARRERLQEGYDHYQLLDQPSGRRGHRRGGVARLLGYSALLLALCAVCLGGGYLLWSHFHGTGRPAAVAPAPQGAAVAPSIAAPGATPGRAEVHFSDGTVVQMSGAPLSAAPAAPGSELPTPVPLSALSPEVGMSLPPPPSGPGAVAAPAPKPFALGAILYDENQRMAIVNGQTVQEGRTYTDFRVLKITPSEVVVQRHGERPTTLVQR